LDDCIEIIKEYYPDYADACDFLFNGNLFIICNTCLMKKEDFYDLCEFMFGVLLKFCEKNGIDPSSDDSFFDYINKDISKYRKMHGPTDVKYRGQARVCAFLSERLLNVWLAKKGYRVKSVKVVDGGVGNL
jgi:hypothetical protein